MEEKAVRKLLHRRLKDITGSTEFRNFFLTLVVLILIIFYLGGQPTFSEIQKRERIDLKSLISACLDAVEMGGKEVVRVRGLSDIGEKSKGQTREGANDPVTEGDMASHRVMYYSLKEYFPNINFVSEERDHKDPELYVPQIPRRIREEANIIGGEIFADRFTIWIDPLGRVW